VLIETSDLDRGRWHIIRVGYSTPAFEGKLRSAAQLPKAGTFMGMGGVYELDPMKSHRFRCEFILTDRIAYILDRRQSASAFVARGRSAEPTCVRA